MPTAASFADAPTAAPAPTERETAFMRRALGAAEEAAGRGEVPVGALVVLGDEIVAVAHNERETGSDPTAHAEIVALRRAAAPPGSWRPTAAHLDVRRGPGPRAPAAPATAPVRPPYV